MSPVSDEWVESEDAAVVLRVTQGVAHLELNREAASNAIDQRMAEDLNASLDLVRRRSDVRVLLLSGRGRNFCAGGDVRAMGASARPSEMVSTLAEETHRAIRALCDLEVPVIAAVHGNAAGAGLGLLCCADVVLSAESCRFRSAFTGVGVTPDSGTSWHLPRIVGVRRALDLILTNRVLDAQEALGWGLVTSVHPDDELLAHAQQLAERLAAGPAVALGAARRLVRRSLTSSLDAHLDAEKDAISVQIDHPEARALIDAFLRRP